MVDHQEFTFSHPLRVRWAECDGQGIVFNVNYFLYFDVGMTEWMRALGFGPGEQVEFFTVHAEADFRAPAKFDDELEIKVRCARLGTKSMTVKMAIWRGEELLTEGAMIYAHTPGVIGETSPLPDYFIARVLDFEKTPPARS